MKKNLICIVAIYCAAVLLFASCSKDKEISGSAGLPEDFKEVTEFLSYTSSIPVDSLEFDRQNLIYYLPGTNFREKYERVREVYYESEYYVYGVKRR